MRLAILEGGHRARARVFLRAVRLIARRPVDPVAQMSLYRPEFFGKPFLALTADVLRGPSFWTPAEREYLAVFTSELNECPFCVRMHTAVAEVESRGELDARHPGSARPELLAVLPLLEKATKDPDQLTAADIEAARAAGVPDEAVVDALHVNLIFNCVNRLANAFGFAWESDEHVRVNAKVIHRISYRLPRFLLR